MTEHHDQSGHEYRSMIVVGGLLLVGSILLVQLPLFNSLGYEFSTGIAFLVPILAGPFTIQMIRRRFSTLTSASDVRYAFVSASVRFACLLGIPLLVVTINLLLVKNCSYGEGLLFFILIPLTTSIWAVSLAVFCAAVFRRSMLVYTCGLIIVLLYPLYLAYATPQIYSYNFIYGFFSGISYDETLRISTTLAYFRMLTLVTAAFMIVLAEYVIIKRAQRISSAHEPGTTMTRSHLVLITVLSLILTSAWIYRGALGFETSPSLIQHSLGGHRSTTHFEIYYSPGSTTSEEIEFIAGMHEFRFHQVTQLLQVDFPDRIVSYIYPDDRLKRRFIGTGNTNIAKPWRGEIHLTKDSWEGTLRHELVHIIAGEFGMPVIKANYNIGLVEGLATAIDGGFGNRTLHEYAAAMLRFGLVRDPERLVRPTGFATQSSSISYVTMGSFCKYLIDQYGIAQFKQLYGGRSPETVYGLPYERLVGDWTHMLDRLPVDENIRPHVEFFFKRPSIFAKECAHAVANLNEDGSDQLAKANPVKAAATYRHALAMSWNSESFAGFVRSSFAAAQYDTVIVSMHRQLQDSMTSSGLANLLLIYGDALWTQGEVDRARRSYEALLKLNLSDRLDEALTVRLMALEDSLLLHRLPSFLVGSLSDSVAYLMLSHLNDQARHPTVPFLLTRLAIRMGKYDEAISVISSMESTHYSSFLDARKEQLLGEAYFRLHNYAAARAHFRQSLDFMSNGASIASVRDILERCDWFQRQQSQ